MFFFAVKVWDMRTKACIHTLTGHTSTVAVVKCQAVEPQVSKQTTHYRKIDFDHSGNIKGFNDHLMHSRQEVF